MCVHVQVRMRVHVQVRMQGARNRLVGKKVDGSQTVLWSLGPCGSGAERVGSLLHRGQFVIFHVMLWQACILCNRLHGQQQLADRLGGPPLLNRAKRERC